LFPSRSVIEKLEGLRRGDLITVDWHDACAFSRAVEINPNVYTTKKRTIGYFYGIFESPDHSMKYLVLVTEETDGVPSEGSSIPVGCIESIHLKTTRKTMKEQMKEAKVSEVPIKTIILTEKIFVEVGKAPDMGAEIISYPC